MRAFPSADTFLTKFKSLMKLKKQEHMQQRTKKPETTTTTRKCLVDFLSLHTLKLEVSIDHVAFLVHVGGIKYAEVVKFN